MMSNGHVGTVVSVLLLGLLLRPGASITVKTVNGDITGSNVGFVHQFVGIPYGESTGGANRWRDPIKRQPWKPNTLDATRWGASCPGSGLPGTSEDCLHINVWTPSVDTSKDGLLPVLVWIHGGGFFTGASSEGIYNGTNFARTKNAVLVSLNYRLGALGFLPSETGTGNFGLRDQNLGLRWVQENIRAFGGDAARVTIFGQSAGACSVLDQLASPSSQNLFRAAAAISPVAIHCRTREMYRKHSEIMFRALKCKSGDFECMRNVADEEVVKHQMVGQYLFDLKDDERFNFLPWIPLCGDDFLPEDPSKVLVENGTFPGVEAVTLGNTAGEMGYFVPTLFNSTFTTDSLIRLIFTKNNEQAIKQLYQADGASSDYFKFVDILSDAIVACYTRHIARGLTSPRENKAEVYLYEFQHPPSRGANVKNWNHKGCDHMACHASDNVFYFNSMADIHLNNASFTPYEAALSNAMLNTMVALAAGGKGVYVPYNAEKDVRLQWGVKGSPTGKLHTTNVDYRQKFCNLWDTFNYSFS